MHSAAGFQITAEHSRQPAGRPRELPVDIAMMAEADGLALDQQRLARRFGATPCLLVLGRELSACCRVPRARVCGGEVGEYRQCGLEPFAGTAEGHRLF